MSLSDAKEGLKSIEAQWNAAGAAWDPEKYATVFADDVLFFGGHPDLFVGKNVKQYFVNYKGLAKSASLKYVEPQFIELGPDTYGVQGFVEFNSVMADGKPAVNKARCSLVISKTNGAWKVRMHQISAIPPDASKQ